MSPLTYTPFPTSALPKSLRTFVEEAAKAIGCDHASLALPALCAAAGVLGNSRRLKIKSTWLAPPILWGCILGESGTSKSPAMRLALAPLREYEKQARAIGANNHSPSQGCRVRVAEDGLPQATNHQPPVTNPPPRRILVSDATTEALAQVASENPLGLLLARDELAGFFGNLDRYGAQSGADEAFFLSAYDGEPINVDRRTAREHIFVPAMALSIIGTCQPAVFAKLMTDQRRASGLLARFLLVEPPSAPKVWAGADIDPQVLADWETTMENLLELNFERAVKSRASASDKPRGAESTFLFDVSPQAAELYRTFYDAHNTAAAKESGDRRAFYSKAEQLPLRLALILHHLHWSDQTNSPIPTRSVSEADSVSRDATRSALQSLAERPTNERAPSPIPTRSVSEDDSVSRDATRSALPPLSERTPDASAALGAYLPTPPPDSDMQISAETMQNALTLSAWFTKETLRVYTLLSLEPEQRLALELEEWIRARGGKTTLAQIASQAPEKFREPKSLAESLLNTLERQSRGSWGPMTIRPVCIDIFKPIPDPGPVKPREFHLKPQSRAA